VENFLVSPDGYLFSEFSLCLGVFVVVFYRISTIRFVPENPSVVRRQK
jgi:hypothetical protein